MTIAEQLSSHLQIKEGFEIEYKSAKGGFPESFWESFSAFANTNGGYIVLGVKEKKGKFIPDGLTEDQIIKYKKLFWDNAHNKSCVNVPLLLEGDVKEMATESGSHLLVFDIPRAAYDIRPVYLTLSPFGHTYKRKHEGDYLCMDDEVRQMFSDANNLKHSADSRILQGYTIDDIDLQTLHQYRRSYDSRHDNHPWSEVDDMKFLENIGAYRKNRTEGKEGFTVAGMLMFGKTNSITDQECCPYFFPDYRERLSDDPRIRWTNRIYPDGTWEANLYQFFTRVLPLMQHALPVPFKLDDNQQRVDKTTAHTSLREAFANTLIHAVYTTMENVVIDRYPNRIVMSNPGSMLVSMEDFYAGNHSVCRNPLLQKMFIFIGVGEKAGSGADTIVKGWKDNGWTLPVIKEQVAPDRVTTTMMVSVTSADNVIENADKPLINQGTVDNVIENVIENGEKVIESNNDVIENVTERQDSIIRLIKARPNITIAEIANRIGVVPMTINRDITVLKEKSILQRIGGDKGGYWQINM